MRTTVNRYDHHDLPGLGSLGAVRELDAPLELELPPQATGQGLVSVPLAPRSPANAVSAIVGVFAAGPSAAPRRSLVGGGDPADLLAQRFGLAHFRLFVRDDAPGLLELEAAGRIRGDGELELEVTEEGERARIALSSGQRVCVECPPPPRSATARRFLVLEPREGRLAVRAVELEEAPSSEAVGRALSATPPAHELLSSPDWHVLLATLPPRPWLRARLGRATRTAGSVGQLVAMGLVLRLHEADLPRPERLRRAGEAGALRDAIRAHLRGAPQAAIELAQREALGELGQLFEALVALRAKVEQEALAADEPGPAAVRALLEARDELESALRALQARREGAALAAELGSVDDLAATLHTLFAAYTYPDDAHLEAVALHEPTSWWGAHAGLHG